MFFPFDAIGALSVELLRPPQGATSGRIRRRGAAGMALGVALLVAAGAMAFALDRLGVNVAHWSRAQLLLVFPGLAFIIVGSYRVIAGREPDDASSLRRIGLGVAGAVVSLVLLLALLIGGAVLYEAILRS